MTTSQLTPAEMRETAKRLRRRLEVSGGTYGDRSDLRASIDALNRLAGIIDRDDEVGEDEGWHIGGAWGDYGEVVVPLRILSYVIGGEFDQQIVSTDPGYALTYAEQVRRAEQAEQRLADVIEYARAVDYEAQVADSRWRAGQGSGSVQGGRDVALGILRIARGETNEREKP